MFRSSWSTTCVSLREISRSSSVCSVEELGELAEFAWRLASVRTQQWALALAERKGHNTAAVALANKTARRLWAAEHHGTRFDPEHVSRREANAA